VVKFSLPLSFLVCSFLIRTAEPDKSRGCGGERADRRMGAPRRACESALREKMRPRRRRVGAAVGGEGARPTTLWGGSTLPQPRRRCPSHAAPCVPGLSHSSSSPAPPGCTHAHRSARGASRKSKDLRRGGGGAAVGSSRGRTGAADCNTHGV
jgi:hypothetical protein